jgi:DHA3 family macrolide efflux protein-like MFS transporter
MTAFLVLWFGQAISVLGTGLTTFARGVWVYRETG